MLSKEFDIQRFLRSLKEFESVEESNRKDSEVTLSQVDSLILDDSKRIKNSLSKKFSEILSEISNFSSAMNSSISDRLIDDEFTIYGDERFTPSTWGGRGDKINNDIKNCLNSLAELVNSESSILSNFDFSSKISSIIYSQLFGKNFNIPEYLFVDSSNLSLFGNFNKIFGFEIKNYIWEFSEDKFSWKPIKDDKNKPYTLDTFTIDAIYVNYHIRVLVKYSNIDNYIITEFDKSQNIIGKQLKVINKLSGLSFLSNFTSLKSYTKDIYNEFKNGIEFLPPDLFSETSSYEESFSKETEYLKSYCQSLLEIAKDIQVRLDTIISDCDDFGRYRGYEGLGNIKGQIINLKKIFKPEYISVLIERIESDLLKITSFSNSGSQDLFESLSSNLLKLSSSINSLCSSLNRIGIKDKELITDRSHIYGSNTREEIIFQLKKLGFNSQQINTVLSSKDLSCSFVFLYDELDEKDIYSYFKGGRLAEYIFYLGGEAAITETLNFLISKNDIKYFISLLEKLRKNRDFSISKNRYIYGNILGSFISIFPEVINYLVGPDYKKYQIEIVTDLITSGKISLSSAELLDKVSQKISDIDDIDFNQANAYPLIIKEFVNLLIPAIEDLQDKYKNTEFLSKINGLSAKELNIILGNTGGRRSYELSGFLSGIEGGRYQSLVSGLIHAVLLPKTSPALLPANRRSFSLGENQPSSSLEELIFKIKFYSDGIKDLSEILLNFSSDEKTLINEPQVIKSTIYSINKDISFSIRNLKENNNPDFISELRKALDANKPGLGNSPEIDSSQKRGILTPAQSREIESLLIGKNSETPNISKMNYDPKVLIQKDMLSKWIKLDFSSLENLNGIIKTYPSIANNTQETSKQFEEIKNKLTDLISDGYINQPKSNYLNSISATTVKKVDIDEVAICNKLGKTLEVCQKEYSSKQKISSEYGNTLKRSSIPIDRPFNVISEEYSSYSKAPGPILIEELSKGKIKASDIDVAYNTEYLSTIDVIPSISFKKELSTRENYNSEEKKILAGLFDLSNNHLYIQKYSKNSKSTIDDCRLISDPIERQLCINHVKCIRFKPNRDKKYLNYCPSSTSGGRLKPL